MQPTLDTMQSENAIISIVTGMVFDYNPEDWIFYMRIAFVHTTKNMSKNCVNVIPFRILCEHDDEYVAYLVILSMWRILLISSESYSAVVNHLRLILNYFF